MNYCLRIIIILIFLCYDLIFSQGRIKFNDQDLFLSGSNVAWVNFAMDIGPGTTNFARFAEIFEEIKKGGGNSFRLWLHTTGEITPEFNGDTVSGPGTGAAVDLKQILDIAWENKIGLLLCLWSHDMMATSRPAILDRNEKLLTDTSAMRSYINNALIPMVNAVKGHPAIIAWEIFNEPEGFTEIGNWGDRRHVRQFDVQRFVNLTAGAIHRTDSTAQVTNGTWGMQALTDVQSIAKVSTESFLESLNAEQKKIIEGQFRAKYERDLSAEEIIKEFYKPQVNHNYYSDDRLIAAGHDPDGTLDFYTVHYYSWAGTGLSPFHNSYSFWGLDKPLAVAEFFMENRFGVPYQELFLRLYNTGYAGALSWQWWGDTQANDNAKNNDHTRTLQTLNYMYENFPYDIVVAPVPGTIYKFSASRGTINYGETAELAWITAAGSSPFLNGEPAADSGRITLLPDTTVIYRLTTDSETKDTAETVIEVLFPGQILFFSAVPPVAEPGEQVKLKWSAVSGSEVRLNNNPVNSTDSLMIIADSTTSFTLSSYGIAGEREIRDTSFVTVSVLPPEQVNRALGRVSFVSSGNNALFINDGDENTIWSTTGSEGEWVQVFLKDYYVVNKIVIKWGDVHARDYRIVNFNHPFKYKVLITRTNSAGGTEEYTGRADTLNNLKIFLDISEGQGYQVREVEIYGLKTGLTDTENVTAVEDFVLHQNFPNPFNPVSVIRFEMPAGGFVSLKVFNPLGKEVAILINEYKEVGRYSVNFNGPGLASGVYIYRININSGSRRFSSSKKMILAK